MPSLIALLGESFLGHILFSRQSRQINLSSMAIVEKTREAGQSISTNLEFGQVRIMLGKFSIFEWPAKCCIKNMYVG